MYNKKGLSAIVATVLIILLVIAGVTLVWSPVRKLITDQSKELEASCLLADAQITKACMSAASTVSVTISNGAEGAIDGFQFIYGITNSLNASVTQSTSAIGVNEIKTLTFTNTTRTTEVKVAPIVGGQTCASGAISTVAPTCA